VTVTLWLAFTAGLVSFLSPCVLTLVPAYISYLGGRSISVDQKRPEKNRWYTFLHGLAFVAGFSLVFIGLGMAASVIGGLLFNIRGILERAGGILIIIFGLHLSGIFRIKWLDYDLRPANRVEENRSYFSSFIMGILFSAGWSPCVGPVLGSILTLAVNEGSMLEGFRLLSVYSAGFAIPFLVFAVAIDSISVKILKFTRAAHIIEIIMGILLILVGLLVFFGQYRQFMSLGTLFNVGL
jgi:cytochrome c-type biogenesis protein